MQRVMSVVESFVTKHELRSVSLPSSWVHNVGGTSPKALVLRSRAWRSAALAWVRLTEIEGDTGTRVFNWAVFPRAGIDAPICQAELIEVKGRLFLLVLDALDWGRPPAAAAALVTLGRDERLPPVAERPAWADGLISAQAVWSRPQTPEGLNAGLDTLRRFMELALRDWYARQEPDPSLTSTQVRFYEQMRTSFLANEPSRPFMHKVFGSGWSEPYMERFLFPSLDSLQADPDPG